MTEQKHERISVGDGSRDHQIFPTLNQQQIELFSRYGERRPFRKGDVLFSEGERHAPMYVLLSGCVEIERGSVDGSRYVGSLGPFMFTGEVTTLAGRAAAATCRAEEDGEALVIDELSLRTLVIAEAELSELIMRAFILRRVAFMQDTRGGVTLIGSHHSAETLKLRQFLARNGQPAAYFDLDEHAEAAELLARFESSADDIPLVVTPLGQVLRKPSMRELADAIGHSPDPLDGKCFDLVVVGAGPGGLAAAVYAASEGLTVAVLDAKAPGGQAGSSSKIENYFGFPTGISGPALAGRGLTQARKFGAEVAIPVKVTSLDCSHDSGKGNGTGAGFTLGLDSNERVHARSLVIATGARYRKPELANLENYEGRGVYYSASFVEGTFCDNEEIIIVGGGNSAGQAAVFMSRFAAHVHIIVRADGLAASMSHYLIQRIEAAPNITLHTRTEIVELQGENGLEKVRWRSKGDAPEWRDVKHVFLFLGAQPNTDWLNGCVALDDKHFVLTGDTIRERGWPLERAPHYLETSHPGVFAVGDVRAGSVKRVAAAVGEGAAAVQSLHQYLALLND